MADDQVDISGMPPPPPPQEAQDDPTAGIPAPLDLYKKAYGGQDPYHGVPKEVGDEALANFMAHPPENITPAEGLKRSGEMLAGVPKAVAKVVGGIAGGLSSATAHFGGAAGAAGALATGRESQIPDIAADAQDRAHRWNKWWNDLADYVPAGEQGEKFANEVTALPGEAIKGAAETSIKPHVSDNTWQTLGEVGGELGTDVQALGAVPGIRYGFNKTLDFADKVRAEGLKGALTPKPKVATDAPLTPDFNPAVTAESLRAAPNPIPPPGKPKAPPRYATVNPAPESPAEPPLGNLPPDRRAATVEGVAARRDAMTDEQRAAYDRANRIPTTGETPEQLQARLDAEADARGQDVGPRLAGGAQRGSVRVMNAPDEEGGKVVPLFNSPAKEGPQETPTPERQGERAGHLAAVDKLSGGLLPTRRTSAITGDYNATGDDYQAKEVGSPGMRQQIASENDALHKATDNVHSSIDSPFANGVDSTTVGNRGRVTRNAIQAIQQHFEDKTDSIYNLAREQNQGRPIPKLQRVSDYLNDDSNFTNDAEIGLQRAAKQRMDRLWSTGDPDKGVPPGSVNAAERLREFLNEKGKNPNAMGIAKELKDHLDMDVAEHGGPGLFETARGLRRHQYQMLEEPTGIKKLLSPGDSQGINHAIPEHKVMDYIADLPREQHAHVMDVLRAGAHLDPELAKSSAAAIREIQAHAVSRMHAAATNADGTWNARKFYNAADQLARNLPETFKDRPDIVNHLKTINDAGNTLAMDKHYPGAEAQKERTSKLGHVLEAGGKVASSLVHDVPIVGRYVGRAIEGGVEGLQGRMSAADREKAVLKRLVDRNGKQRGSVQVMNDERENNASGESSASLEAQNRNRAELAAGRTRHLIDPDGNVTPLTGVDAVDRAAPKGHVIYQKGTGIVDRGGLPESHAAGLVNRARANGFDTTPKPAAGSQLNIGLHQGQEGQPGFRKMSKQEAAGAVESTGAKVTKSSVLTPQAHGVAEPALVASTNRPLSEPEMQKVLAKTKQSAIPQRTEAGEESMHVAPGHEEIAKNEGWDKFNPDYFREHDGTVASAGKQRGSVRLFNKARDLAEDIGERTNSEMTGFDDSMTATHDYLRHLPKRIKNAVGSAAEDVGERVNSAMTGFDDNMTAAHDYLRHLPKRIKNAVGSAAEDLGESVNSHLNTLDDKISDAHDFLRHLPKRIADATGSAAEDMGERVASIHQGIDDKIADVHDVIRHLPKNIANKVGSASEDLGEHVASLHQSVDDKIADAITAAERKVGIRGPENQRGSVRVMNEKPLAGAPEGDRPNAVARTAAAAYMKKAGVDAKPLSEYRYVDPKVAKNVADAYEEMKHDPTDPKVAKSYDAFKSETLAQYKQMLKAGVKPELQTDYPYKNPREMHEDVRANNHMAIYPTEAGFGSGDAAASDHPLMEKAPVKMGGKDATYNDLFRAVHDYYGHAAEGNGFRANGEYNAWRAHRQMYSEAARGAMDSETLGQNSWVNSGPAAALNKGASGADTVYADQKAGLLPKSVVDKAVEGVGADEHHITNQLTDSERDQLRTDTTKRLVEAFNSAPATKEYAAAALAGAAKRGWYRNSAQAIVNQFGHEAPRFAGLLSAMSPQVSVQTNFANALKTYINWDKAGRPEDPAEIRAIMEQSSQKSAKAAPGSSNVLDAWVNNAVRALTADDPSNIKLSGPKVHSFYNNLTDNVHEVTNDAWMSSFAKIDPSKLGGKINDAGPGKSPSYMALSAKVRDAARMISHLTGETWTPAEVQETVWSWAKTAYEHAEEKGSNVSIPDLVKNGDITDELIRSTPDFHQLFGTSEHRGLLQSSRFAGNAERVAAGKEQSTDTAGTSKARQAAAEALRPHLISAAERLEQVRQERRAAGKKAPKDEE